jgi:hypothetical protein
MSKTYGPKSRLDSVILDSPFPIRFPAPPPCNFSQPLTIPARCNKRCWASSGVARAPLAGGPVDTLYDDDNSDVLFPTFTVKRYRTTGGRVVLEPVNADFAPLVVNDGDEVRVIAEVMKVLG